MPRPELYVIYLTTDLTNNFIYVGQHKCKTCYEGLDCGYRGSGTLFTKVVNARGKQNFSREVLYRSTSKKLINKAEIRFIAELQAADRKVGYNLLEGVGTTSSNCYSLKECSIHGQQVHSGLIPKCCVCTSRNSINTSFCDTHGDTSFRGKTCLKCSLVKRQHYANCAAHGFALFQGSVCRKCVAMNSRSKAHCEIHGEANFIGKTCTKCSVSSHFSIKLCSIHGETKHSKDMCCKCVSRSHKDICAIHGEANFQGSLCSTCKASKSMSLKSCKIHGESKHKGNTCLKCSTKSKVTLVFCKIHQIETKHQHGKCLKCRGGSNQHSKRNND